LRPAVEGGVPPPGIPMISSTTVGIPHGAPAGLDARLYGRPEARRYIRFSIRKRREVTSIQKELPCRKRGHLSPLAYYFKLRMNTDGYGYEGGLKVACHLSLSV